MDNQVWSQVTAELARRREENEREENRRREEIQQKHPDLKRLMEERHSLIMNSVLSAFSGAAQNAEQLMADYNRRIAALLAEKGYPSDYLAPVCQCKICGDMGYIYENNVQTPCVCAKRAYALRAAPAGQGGGEESFASFDEGRFPDTPLPGTDVTQRQYMRIVRDKCLQFVRGVPGGPVKTLLLHGGSGLGKTFLLHCVERAARENGADTLYATAYDVLNALKTAYFSRTGETAEEYFTVPLLLIDDLGMEPLMENVTVEQIYNLINARLEKGLYTAISTNLSREELKNRYTERVTSRLLDTRRGMAIPFLGKDIRLIK